MKIMKLLEDYFKNTPSISLLFLSIAKNIICDKYLIKIQLQNGEIIGKSYKSWEKWY